MTYRRIEQPTLLDEAGTLSASRLTQLLQQTAGGPQGYRLRRIILTNFWLYEYQTFEIPHGRLFLAGDNGSGKSTVLTAAITLALDGDYRPERIDTFGKREKKIDYYVIGGNESNTPFNRDQRTSYIALEFEWSDMQEPPFASELRSLWEAGNREQARFLTIGLGFSGNKNNVNPITALRFLITDGTRLGGPTLSTLVTTSSDNSRACDLKSFKKMLSMHGVVCDNQADYARKVAQYLFNFQKPEDLARLTRQLLYLRQPNLNSVLSLEKVRSYLDESLPELPVTLIERAAEMLNMMEELQAATEKRRSAYNAVSKVHRSQQIVAMAKARLSACEHLAALTQLGNAQKEVRRLERSLKKIERDIEQYNGRVKDLEKEELELTGKIQALESSEGLQLAERLTQAQAAVRTCQENLRRNKEALSRAIERRERTEDTLETLKDTFGQRKDNTIRLLQSMHTSTEQEIRWSIAADQLAQALERVQALTLDAELLDIPERLSSLGDHSLHEQLQWLEGIRTLHNTLEQVKGRLQDARQHEQGAYNALDAMTRQFEDRRDAVCATQQDLADQLELLLEASTWSALVPPVEQAALIWNASLPPTESVPALERVQQTYTDAIKQIGEAITSKRNSMQEPLNKAYKQQGIIEEEIKRVQAAYQQKLQEPEFVPIRAPHRQQAREQLVAQGIAALPFYMLIDFTEEIESLSPLAGGIEQALEDAGLLDALVVLPEDTAAMDDYCLAHGLNDCRLDLSHLDNEQRLPLTLARALRVDPALPTSIGERATDWTSTVQALLDSMRRSPIEERYELWTHGMLTGTVGTGTARCIGKATRVRTQQQELQRLREQQKEFDQQLEEVTARIKSIEQQRHDLATLRTQLDALLPESQLHTLHASLQAASGNLNQAQASYTRAKEASEALAQQSFALQAHLRKEAGDTPIFAVERGKVEQACEALNNLKSDYKTLLVYLPTLRTIWQDRREAQRQLRYDRIDENNAELVKRRDAEALTRSSAELEELQRLAQSPEAANIEEMLKQLTAWKTRQLSLPEDLKTARTDQTRAEAMRENQQNAYGEALEKQRHAEQHNSATLEQFRHILTFYPVEILADIRSNIQDSSVDTESLYRLIGEQVEPTEDAYTVLKNTLMTGEATAGHKLSEAFVEVSSLLHEYGPHFDESGIIRFTNAENANAYDLLSRLGEEIRQHELLLEAKEYELFQNFLLKEMANTVGTRLTDAEAWVQRMNDILVNALFIGERYRLKWVLRPHDPTRPGSHLAQYRDVLRKQAETYNEEMVAALVHAFRQEIATLRSQQTTTSATFAEGLMSILDYRRWFQFEIDVLRQDNTSQRLTNKFFRKGSGAEQYIALYIPFFAALSALYESAGKGAPRLIALDEAFDKVSTENTRKLLNFLAEQNFQWIMSGPRVTGEGTMLPACVKYTMFCRKADELAAGFPSFWSNNPAIARELQVKQ
jgi:hypothetical protein